MLQFFFFFLREIKFKPPLVPIMNPIFSPVASQLQKMEKATSERNHSRPPRHPLMLPSRATRQQRPEETNGRDGRGADAGGRGLSSLGRSDASSKARWEGRRQKRRDHVQGRRRTGSFWDWTGIKQPGWSLLWKKVLSHCP